MPREINEFVQRDVGILRAPLIHGSLLPRTDRFLETAPVVKSPLERHLLHENRFNGFHRESGENPVAPVVVDSANITTEARRSQRVHREESSASNT